MAFKKTAELGERDSRIWTGGSVNPEKKGITRRSQVQSELSSLIRKFRPLQAESIRTAMKIMSNDESADANRLKASALIISTYQSLLRDLNNLGEDEESTTVEKLIEQPRFSLVMMPEKKDS